MCSSDLGPVRAEEHPHGEPSRPVAVNRGDEDDQQQFEPLAVDDLAKHCGGEHSRRAAKMCKGDRDDAKRTRRRESIRVRRDGAKSKPRRGGMR